MSLQRVIASAMEWVPQNIHIAMRGKRSQPSKLANAIHAVLNRLPVQRYPVLKCSGVLDGYRMKIDWKKNRSFAYGTYEPEVVRTISRVVSAGMTALDIGAHSGFFTLLLAKVVGPKGRVVAFEPLPANFRMLQENVRLNSLMNVRLEKQGVHSNSGQLTFEVPDAESFLLAGPMHHDDERPTTMVLATSLDLYVFQHDMKVDFIKIDVEGAEDDVLKGAEKTIKAFHPAMVIEVHDLDKQSRPHSGLAVLAALGYELEPLGEALYTTHVLARWKEHGQLKGQA